MDISIFGLGYVGAVSAGCLAEDGNRVIGVDPNKTKVDLINEGVTPIIEQDIGDIIKRNAQSGSLSATVDPHFAVKNTEISLLCVGTPSEANGSLDLRYVRKVCEEIGAELKNKADFHVVVIRSTMLPGSMRDLIIPTLEEYSGKKAGEGFGICNNPEFLREGTAVYDYYNPPKTVIGEIDQRSGDMLAKLYSKLDAPMIRTSVETAEMVKYVDNVWHALKVGFANEVGNICKQVGVDGHDVMEIFCQDKKLNLSPYYLKPGFAFGGSCLPKDVRALTYKAKMLDLDVPILNSILPSNQIQIETGINMVLATGKNRVGILGMSFKAGTDDLRESPIVELIERLLGKGFDINIYDKNVNLAALTGANKDYIMNRIPHISRLLKQTKEEVVNHADVIVIGNGDKEFQEITSLLNSNHSVIDLVRVAELDQLDNYEGIGW